MEVIKMKKKIKHLEVDGCSINIRQGLENIQGQMVTSIQIIVDDGWECRADGGKPAYLNVRVVRE